MPKYLHPDVLDNGLQHIIDQCSGNVDLLLIKAYVVLKYITLGIWEYEFREGTFTDEA